MSWATSTRRSRLPSNWDTIRAYVLHRDDWRCQIRGPRCAGRASDVDHIERGDNHAVKNLQAACRPCHASKSSREGRAAKASPKRAPETHPGIIR
jgi:5-methylcytosine-specific restriction protein A